MKPKPKISKGEEGWTITIPAFGFGNETTVGPFETFEQVRVRFVRHRPVASASPIIERTETPETYWKRQIWPEVIR